MNSTVFNINDLTDIINNEGKITAIKALHQNNNLGLKEAKDLVEDIVSGNFKAVNIEDIHKSESVNILKKNNKTTVTYTNQNGESKQITPRDPEWQNARNLMKDNEILDEIENQFNPKTESETETVYSSSPIIQEKKNPLPRIIVFVLLLLIIAYFVWTFMN